VELRVLGMSLVSWPSSSFSEATAAIGAVLAVPGVPFLAGRAGLLGHGAEKVRPAAFPAPRRLIVADGPTSLAGL
jgi:hypothetical protein